MTRERTETVSSLANSRFDWERALRDLSRALPSGVTLNSLVGTLSSTTNTFSVAGNVLRTGGTFNHNNGRFVFSGAVFQNARTANAIFNDVFHPIAGTVKLLDSFNAIGSFTNSALGTRSK